MGQALAQWHLADVPGQQSATGKAERTHTGPAPGCGTRATGPSCAGGAQQPHWRPHSVPTAPFQPGAPQVSPDRSLLSRKHYSAHITRAASRTTEGRRPPQEAQPSSRGDRAQTRLGQRPWCGRNDESGDLRGTMSTTGSKGTWWEGAGPGP